MSGWVYPPSIPPRYRAKLDDACDLGGSTFLASGIDPGFMNDALVLLLSGFSRRITSIRGQELLNYDTYLVDEVLFDKLGFGRTREGEAAHRPGSYAKAWAGVVEWIAGGLGVTLDEIVDARDAWYTPTPIEHAGWRIDADTVAAIRFEVRGIVGGEPRIVLEHVTRLARDAAPDWPQPPGHGGYRVEIDGIPAMRMEVALDEPGGDANIAALIATAQRAVNAIPVICEAPPGVKSWFDLPPVVGAHAFRV
jgi:4-hydroxy-tetrahydrodipicolinate reductase